MDADGHGGRLRGFLLHRSTPSASASTSARRRPLVDLALRRGTSVAQEGALERRRNLHARGHGALERHSGGAGDVGRGRESSTGRSVDTLDQGGGRRRLQLQLRLHHGSRVQQGRLLRGRDAAAGRKLAAEGARRARHGHAGACGSPSSTSTSTSNAHTHTHTKRTQARTARRHRDPNAEAEAEADLAHHRHRLGNRSARQRRQRGRRSRGRRGGRC